MFPSPVAVVDIGSNSIKVLVARAGSDGLPETVLSETIEARISAGIGGTTPRLSAEGMARGLDAISALLALAAPHQPGRVQLVATSAVRDAANGPAFRDAIKARTGHEVRILSGDEEANLIGRGLTCDPTLRHLTDFYLFDLGGGSLECLSFAQRTIRHACSLPLGCVRLTERFVSDRSAPVSPTTLDRLAHHVAAVLAGSEFRFDLPAGAVAVGTGGTMTTARAILAAQQRQSLADGRATLDLDALRNLLATVAALPLADRRQVAGLSPNRADVFPTAVATLIAVADAGRFSAYHHSFYNLRYGLAAELLQD